MSELENLNTGELCIHYKVCRIKPCHAHCGEYLPKDYFVTDRPHGEWVHAEEYDYLDENGVEHFHIKCPNCGFLHDCFDCHTAQYNFCPECGSDNRKREGEEK